MFLFLCILFVLKFFSLTVDGGYGQWSKYSACTKSCGGGSKVRQRECNNPKPENGGKDCSLLGPGVESVTCNTQACPGMVPRYLEQSFVEDS